MVIKSYYLEGLAVLITLEEMDGWMDGVKSVQQWALQNHGKRGHKVAEAASKGESSSFTPEKL